MHKTEYSKPAQNFDVETKNLHGQKATGYYSYFTDGTRLYINEIILRLQRISEEVPLDQFPKDEQLAYWLNLHNIIVINEISKRYPITNIKKLYSSDSTCEVLTITGCNGEIDHTSILISGKRTNLGQIRRHILTNWSDPLVIYGLYMGYIGGPNIRESAYKGTTVWKQLQNNAEEFVNSIRGTQIWGNTLRISEHYNLATSTFFPSEDSIYTHLSKYADGKLKNWLGKTNKIKATVHDGSINDLYNGQPYVLFDIPKATGDIIAKTSRNFLPNYGPFADLGNHPLLSAFQRNLQKKFKQQRKDINTNVEIEEISRGKTNNEDQNQQ